MPAGQGTTRVECPTPAHTATAIDATTPATGTCEQAASDIDTCLANQEIEPNTEITELDAGIQTTNAARSF